MLRTISAGKKRTVAIIFGKIKNDAEFIPIISSASICSVTLIEPISDAMFDPTLPARIKASIVGQNSRINDSLVAYPIKYFGYKGLSKL